MTFDEFMEKHLQRLGPVATGYVRMGWNACDKFGGDAARFEEVPEARAIIDRVIAELEAGFVACNRCGDQEDTATLDCMSDLKRVQALLAIPPSNEVKGEGQVKTDNTQTLANALERIDELERELAGYQALKRLHRLDNYPNEISARAWLLRKQAEAIEDWLHGDADMGDLSDYATCLRQQADELEKVGEHDA